MSTIAAAAGYQEHPIRAVVHNPAGASHDTVTRMPGEGLTERIDHPLIVKNYPGGSDPGGLA